MFILQEAYIFFYIRKVADRKFRDPALKFSFFDFLSKDLYNDIYDLGVLYNFESPTESLTTVDCLIF